MANSCIYVLMYVLGWFEAARGCLIGPKTWDRIVEIFFRLFGQPVNVQKFMWAVMLEFMH